MLLHQANLFPTFIIALKNINYTEKFNFMPINPRRHFVKRFFMAGIGLSPLVKSLQALPLQTVIDDKIGIGFPNTDCENQVLCTGDDPYIIDVHCHPNLKNYLLGKKMYRHFWHFNAKGTNRYNMQVDMHNMQKGNVRGFIAAHVLPESGMVTNANANRRLVPFLRKVLPLLAEKVENGDESNYSQLTYMLDEFEAHIKKTNEKKGGQAIKIAKTYAEFEAIINEGKQIAVAQSVEGFHALGRRIGLPEYLERLNFLADRGICMIVLAHFFPNDAAYMPEGIEPYEKHKLKLNWEYDPRYDNRHLTDIGKAVVWHMLERGILIDLTHMSPNGRLDVFAIHKDFVEKTQINRPLLFSHGGFQNVYDKYKPNPIPAGKKDVSNYKFKSPNEAEVLYIKKTDGVIGVMGENFWLTGNDDHTSYTNTADFEDGIPYIIETIKELHRVTGCYRYVALGSDFDGFANAPADFRNPKYFKDLVERIKAALPDCDINAITHCNAMRVLKNGWTNKL